ncbi:MAG TPA: alpha-glucan family phosphorylase [Sedimentisphaerales bacterium]|nr:alpha-glucan family phosphorylase [Sedimentisphaerales bacterium]
MIFKNIFVYPKYPENLEKLYTLAYNLWCTWNYEAVDLFQRIDLQLFRAVNHNPVKFLLSLSKHRISELSEDRDFLFELERVWGIFQDYTKYSWTLGSENADNGGLARSDVIAYFAMEFGLHECIPTYGGGLGVLSGDFLKAASDLGLPVVGVSLIYKFGYFTQRINSRGYQEELFVEFENHLVPMREVHCPNGEKACINIKVLNRDLRIKLWQIDVGQTKLVLLDTDIEDNPPDLRDITYELYVADRNKRLQQELVLGLGGVKALELLNIEPKVYHINEGHSAFLVIARLQKLMAEKKLSFSEAKALIRASTVFTTHTPVVAGNENFQTELVKKYLEPEIELLGLSFDEVASHGFIEEGKDNFWLPALAIRFAKYVNCVSRLHRDVSRRMWASLFPATPLAEVPMDYVTNGVHCSWLSEPLTDLFKKYVGPGYIHCGRNQQLWDKVKDMTDEEIWDAHHKNKQSMVTFMRRKLGDDLAARGYVQPKILRLSRLFNAEYFTIVFARRFAHYKRATLILKDKERLKKILTDTRKPVQLIFAGKAHPADTQGKNMIKEIIAFIRDYQLEDRVIFLENYDMNVARHLVCGADLWLNTPVRENEASGTSGMKAAINGVLNLSVLDGWWPEGYNGRNGWAITAGEFYRHSEMQETAEADQIYDLLEEEITELYYDRNEAGIPKHWVQMMKESICSVCATFNMNRVLTCYLNKLYVPSRKHSAMLCKDNFHLLKEATEKEQEILKYWDKVEIAGLSTNVDKKDHIVEQERLEVHCAVDLDKASPELFCVELFYMRSNSDSFRVVPMQLESLKGTFANYACSFEIEGYGLQHINARIKPANETVQDLHPELVKWKE